MTSCRSKFVVKLNDDKKDGNDIGTDKKIKMMAKKETWIAKSYTIMPIVQERNL